jgi:hypothetical protein
MSRLGCLRVNASSPFRLRGVGLGRLQSRPVRSCPTGIEPLPLLPPPGALTGSARSLAVQQQRTHHRSLIDDHETPSSRPGLSGPINIGAIETGPTSLKAPPRHASHLGYPGDLSAHGIRIYRAAGTTRISGISGVPGTQICLGAGYTPVAGRP